jgi:xanthine dehydrogenase YagS FAD-binding subunit
MRRSGKRYGAGRIDYRNPAAPGEQSHYLKLRDRASFEFALVSAAVIVVLDGDRIGSARVAMGGIGTRPCDCPGSKRRWGVPATLNAISAAAAHAAEGIRPLPENGFKVKLMQRVLTRALLTVTA